MQRLEEQIDKCTKNMKKGVPKFQKRTPDNIRYCSLSLNNRNKTCSHVLIRYPVQTQEGKKYRCGYKGQRKTNGRYNSKTP